MNDSSAPRTKFILVLDDDVDDLFLMERAITTASYGDVKYELFKAGHAVEARSLLAAIILRRQPGDEVIVFSDVNMPGETGLQFLQWFKAQPDLRNLPVIIISSFDKAADITHALHLALLPACLSRHSPTR